MSRWTDNFRNHAYAATWEAFKLKVNETTLDDESIQTSVEELARLDKVTTFIDGLLKTLDPELIPLPTWDNFNKQCQAATQQLDQFAADRNVGHLNEANKNLDNLLTYVRPYMVAEGKAALALRDAAVDAANQISERYTELKKDAQGSYEGIESLREDGEAKLTSITRIHERIDEFEKLTFGDEETEGSEQKINTVIAQIESQYDKINGFHDEIFVGEGETPSIKQEIASAREDVLADRKSIGEQLAAVKGRIDDLDEFYIKIFGDPDSEEKHKGLAGELDLRKEELKSFEKEQKERYKALNEKINGLLPGATSAGLANAYHEMKVSFDAPIKTASRLFYGSIMALVVLALVLSWESIGGAQTQDWDAIFKGLVYRLPLYGPIIWLAFYASKRRSECQRLQQEYAHKEALAKSYDSYKQQIEALNSGDTDMLNNLITKAIDAISYNASETLDKRHGDRHPAQELAEKAANEFAQKVAR